MQGRIILNRGITICRNMAQNETGRGRQNEHWTRVINSDEDRETWKTDKDTLAD